MNVNEIIEGVVVDIAFGGQGVIRHQGFVVFVPFTAVGEFVRCRIIQIKSSFAHAEIVNILDPNPERIAPKCPYFGTCGGCQFQHLNYPTQLQMKQKILQDALERIAKLNNILISSIIPSPSPWNYRRHVTLQLHPSDGSYQACYSSIDNQTLIQVEQCQIFVPLSEDIIKQIQNLIKNLKSDPDNNGRVTLMKAATSRFILYFQFKKLPSNFKEAMKEAIKDQKWQGIIAKAEDQLLTFGNIELQYSIDSLQFQFSPLAFIQNHQEQSVTIYRKICQLIEQIQPKKVLDLYCGIGTIGIMIAAKGISSLGVEGSEEAIRLAKLNAKRNNKIEAKYLQSDVNKVIKTLMEKEKPDLVLLNPPRQGLTPIVIKSLLSSLPKDILYVSCMPATLARDLKALCQEKYQIKECQPFDMFPQTTHLETLVHLEWRG